MLASVGFVSQFWLDLLADKAYLNRHEHDTMVNNGRTFAGGGVL